MVDSEGERGSIFSFFISSFSFMDRRMLALIGNPLIISEQCLRSIGNEHGFQVDIVVTQEEVRKRLMEAQSPYDCLRVTDSSYESDPFEALRSDKTTYLLEQCSRTVHCALIVPCQALRRHIESLSQSRPDLRLLMYDYFDESTFLSAWMEGEDFSSFAKLLDDPRFNH